jgi:hypothetical protein
MAAPRKLTDSQREEIARRSLTESASALGREFNVSEGAVRKIAKAYLQGTEGASQGAAVRDVAQKIVDGRTALKLLTPPAQRIAMTLADEMEVVSSNLAGAANYTSAVAHRFAYLAHAQVQKIDDADPFANEVLLRGSVGMVKAANEAAKLGIDLIAAVNSGKRSAEPEKPPQLDEGARAARAAQLLAVAKRRKEAAA